MKDHQEPVCTNSIEPDKILELYGHPAPHCFGQVGQESRSEGDSPYWFVLFWLHLLSGGGSVCRAVSVVVGNNRHFQEPFLSNRLSECLTEYNLECWRR
jgi:hypothetical protein